MKKVSKHSSRRRFSEEFKKQRVKEHEQGKLTVAQISRLYTVSETSVYNWLHKYSYFYQNNWVIVEEKHSNSKKLDEAERRIAELEKKLGQNGMLIDYYEEMIKIASQEFDIDLKKNLDIKRLKR